MHADGRTDAERAIAAAADVLRPWAPDLRVNGHDAEESGPTAQPLVVDPATAIAGLSLLLSVLTFWQTERHHRAEMDRLDRDARARHEALRDEVAALRTSPEQVVEELAAVPPEDLAAARAALAEDPAVRTDVAALLGRAGVPVTHVAAALDDLAHATT